MHEKSLCVVDTYISRRRYSESDNSKVGTCNKAKRQSIFYLLCRYYAELQYMCGG